MGNYEDKDASDGHKRHRHHRSDGRDRRHRHRHRHHQKEKPGEKRRQRAEAKSERMAKPETACVENDASSTQNREDSAALPAQSLDQADADTATDQTPSTDSVPVPAHTADEPEEDASTDGGGGTESDLHSSNRDIEGDNNGHDAIEFNREIEVEDEAASSSNASEEETPASSESTAASDAASSTAIDDRDKMKAEIAYLLEEITTIGSADELEVLRVHLRAMKSQPPEANRATLRPATTESDISESDPSSHRTNTSDTSNQSEFTGNLDELSETQRAVLVELLGCHGGTAVSATGVNPDDTQEDERPHREEGFRDDIRRGIEKMCDLQRQMLEQQVMRSAPSEISDEYYAALANAAVQNANALAKKRELDARIAEFELVKVEQELRKLELETAERRAGNDGGGSVEDAAVSPQ